MVEGDFEDQDEKARVMDEWKGRSSWSKATKRVEDSNSGGGKLGEMG